MNEGISKVLKSRQRHNFSPVKGAWFCSLPLLGMTFEITSDIKVF